MSPPTSAGRPSVHEWTAAAKRDAAALARAEGCDVRLDEPLARHTSMGVGGTTPLMVWPHHPEAVAAIAAWLASHGLGWRVLGGGTNVLIGEAGVPDAVLNVSRLTDRARIHPPEVTLPAGITTAQALRSTLREGLVGLVWSTGLPGTIGGAAAGNAGCWGGEMADVVTRLDVITSTGSWKRLGADELTWSYRHVDLEERAGRGATIVAVGLELEEGSPTEGAARSAELQRIKRERQPVGARNAGCIFRNPDEHTPAGRLIDEAGCKGLRVGGAEVSDLHGNFIVNRGDASADDVARLIAKIKSRVAEHGGIVLEEEIRRW